MVALCCLILVSRLTPLSFNGSTMSEIKSNIPLDLINCQYMSSVPCSHSNRTLALQSIFAQDKTYRR